MDHSACFIENMNQRGCMSRIFIGKERECRASLSTATGAANPMNIYSFRCGKIEVYHKSDIVHIYISPEHERTIVESIEYLT